jgi:hypothetical protein
MTSRRINKTKLKLIRKNEYNHELQCSLCGQEVYECSNKECACSLVNGEEIYCEPEAMPWIKHYCKECGLKEKGVDK